MTDSVRAFFLIPPEVGMLGSAGFTGQVGSALWPEGAPSILWGQGTPNGDLAPFNLINKGSFYLQVDAADDSNVAWLKVDEGGDNDDWVRLITSPMTYAAVATASAYINAVDIRVTNSGSGAAFITGLYVQINEPATKSTDGYFCAAEFELNCECSTSSSMAVLSLGSGITAMGSDTYTSFIKMQDWGTEEMPYLFDITSIDIGSNVKTCLFSTTQSDITATHALRICRAGVPYWILVSSAGPA